MKTLSIVLTAACLVLASCSRSKPEVTLVKRLEAMEQIMKNNMDKPEAGVSKLIAYYEKNGADTIKLMMDADIKLAKIEGKGDRDKRVKEIEDTLNVAVSNFEGTSGKFIKAVENDKKAKALWKDYAERSGDLRSMHAMSKALSSMSLITRARLSD